MENKFLKLIKSRVSCRDYSDKKVSAKKIMAVAEAGKYAPSGKNRQISFIFVIKNKRNVEKLRSLSFETLNRDCMYGTKTILLVAAPRGDDFTLKDCSCILENMFLAAHSLGLGSCWINQFDTLFQSEKGLKIKKSLKIPDDLMIVGGCILGYVKEGVSLIIKERKENFIKIL